jgi:hypothetical protein
MPVTVSGLKELQASLRKVYSSDLATFPEVVDALQKGVNLIAQDAQSRVPSRSGRAARSIKPGSSGSKAWVQGGGSVRYYGWLDFGSRNPRKGNPRKKGPWSGSGHGPDRGRFIYPAGDAKTPEMVESLQRSLAQVIRRAGLDVN